MDAKSVTAENKKTENQYAENSKEIFNTTKQEIKSYTQEDLGKSLAFIAIFLALYLPLSIILALLSLVNIDIMSTTSLAIVIGLAVYYSFS